MELLSSIAAMLELAKTPVNPAELPQKETIAQVVMAEGLNKAEERFHSALAEGRKQQLEEMPETRFNKMMDELNKSKSRIQSVSVINGVYNIIGERGDTIQSFNKVQLSPAQFNTFIGEINTLPTSHPSPRPNFSEGTQRQN